MTIPPLALIVAAGRGIRAGGGMPKQYRAVAEKPLLRHAVLGMQAAGLDVRVVFNPDDAPLYEAAVAGLDLPPPIAGGATRQDSVRAGLEALGAAPPALVFIHDAARAFTPASVVARLLAALADPANDGAAPALPVADSIRTGIGHFTGEVDRSALLRVQTPQAFRFDAILAAHRAAGPGATDDLAMAMVAGLKIAVVPGDERGFKVTEPEDFVRAEAMLAARGRTVSASGFDVHRFGPGDHVWLCGVRVAHGHGLIGHSDADAGLHALTDALLGTVGAGDIGDHFPPTDPRWAGAASDQFLGHAADLVAAGGGRIEHVDVTLICERPRIGPHRDAMRARIAAILALPLSHVSVKATTTELLGFTGRQEGLAAQAMATVRLPE